MIHFGNLLADMGIQTYAEDDEAVPADMLAGGRRVLAWNDTIDEWVNEMYHLIFDQELSSTGHNNVWVAWHENPAERKRVIWKSVRYGDEAEEKLRWVSFDNEKDEWKINADGAWIFSTHP